MRACIMGFHGPPPDTLGGGAIEKPDEERADSADDGEMPSRVAEHIQRTA